MNKALCASLIASLFFAGCSSNGTNPPAPQQQANVASNVLQLAVGTANLYGTAVAVNVVTTYRQPANGFRPGASGTLLNSPTLTFPNAVPGAAGTPASYDSTSTVRTGPSAGETGGKNATSTSQSTPPASSLVTSFGQSGGVFGSGIEPFNATGPLNAPSANSIGTPFQVAPYPVPLYDNSSPSFAAGADPNMFVPWGGPPAYDILGNGHSPVGNSAVPGGYAGVPMAIDVFAGVAPVASGTYTLAVSIPANNGTSTTSKSFTLPGALTVLGNAAAPAYVQDGNGGGTFAFVMPAGATDALIQITDAGPTGGCNGSSLASPYYYTIHMTASGTATLPDTAGAGGKPSICTAAQNAGPGDEFSVQTIAFDYPFFAASYPSSLGNPTPSIISGASSDITISPAVCSLQPAGGGAFGPCTDTTPLASTRRIQTFKR